MAIPTRIDTATVVSNATGAYQGGGTQYLIETPTGKVYMVFIDVNSDPAFMSSLDGGMTWGAQTALKSITTRQISVWYDRWSGINADLIHVVYTDTSTSDVFYRNINIANSDSLSTEHTVFAGASSAVGGAISISRMRGGNLICVGSIDLATEIFSRKSTDVGVNWSDITAGYEASGNADQCIVLPGWGADNQDAMMFYYDRSATEISVKYYDDSANTWSEASIATTISLPDHTSATLGHMSAAIDLTNSQNLLVFWTAIDTANADLRCFKVTQSAQTETTSNVVLNSTDDQGFCGICIDSVTNYWYVFYLGNSSGSETYNTSISLYFKQSTDGGATWGSETALTTLSYQVISLLYTNPIQYKKYGIVLVSSANPLVKIYNNAQLSIPRASYQIGI